ncbi:transposase [Prosthecomicrobium sp. N25]|uniref:transposase n=1 Tax=Prosthecomicrobium sp. N25 TaxID=3129254 RepID=UPI003077E3F9
MTKVPRVEVITSVELRRRWRRSEKERLVAASFEDGVMASEIARDAGIHVSQLFRWRKELCQSVTPRAEGTALVPIEVVPVARAPDPVDISRRREPGCAAKSGRSRSTLRAAPGFASTVTWMPMRSVAFLTF